MFRVSFLIMALCTASLVAANPNPEELGKVSWHRNLTEAQQIAKEKNKPILILFQEIPGCLTCRTYGREVLSHPLIVETIETYFVPLAIYNNRRGNDAEVLSYYNEPSWNNPVVRLVNADKSDVQPRLNGNYTPSGLVKYLIAGMKKKGYSIPEYLPILYTELAANEKGIEKTTLSMYCFWTGEKELGKIEGVVQTEAGFMDHHEVVNVYYDPSIVSLEEILDEGKRTSCADQAYVNQENERKKAGKTLGTSNVKNASTFRPDKEPKYYLSKTGYRLVPMSPTQAVKINVLIGQGKSPFHLLSPRQQMMYNHLQKDKSVRWASEVNDNKWQEKMFKAWDDLGSRA
ncbi:MAG: thioredoxin family protein [Saprospiraceae bacterium]|nr:thioredoxin family protein [Saprospiraceae bacterium]